MVPIYLHTLKVLMKRIAVNYSCNPNELPLFAAICGVISGVAINLNTLQEEFLFIDINEG